MEKFWCSDITIFTVNFIPSHLGNIYPRDQTLIQQRICFNRQSVTPQFQNITIPSNYQYGARVNYQLSHNCTKDGKPDCVQLRSCYFVLFRSDSRFEEEFNFAPHELGIPAGRGKCKD